MPALAIWAPEDGVLGAVAPLALAIAQPTALVVDLDPHGPAYPSERSLRDLVEGSVRSAELRPARGGLAVLRNGGVAMSPAKDVVAHLLDNWPAVVLRTARPTNDVPAPIVPVRLLVAGRLFPPQGRGVYQRTMLGEPAATPPGSITLPSARRHTLKALLDGRPPAPSRWLGAWRRVWEMPW